MFAKIKRYYEDYKSNQSIWMWRKAYGPSICYNTSSEGNMSRNGEEVQHAVLVQLKAIDLQLAS